MKKDLNTKKRNLRGRIMEIIKENQFRILLIIILLGYVVGLAYVLIQINQYTSNFREFISNFVNWVFIIIATYVFIELRPLIKQVWKQTYIRDNIEKQTAIKLELENIKLMKSMGLKFNKDKVSKDIKELLEKNSD